MDKLKLAINGLSFFISTTVMGFQMMKLRKIFKFSEVNPESKQVHINKIPQWDFRIRQPLTK
jgi:hypothetical protein